MGDTDKIAEKELGYQQGFYCKLKIKDLDFNPIAIKNMVIKESIFDMLPRMEMDLIDDDRLFEKYAFEENDIIQIELSKNIEEEKPLKMEFQLQGYYVKNSTSESTLTKAEYHITGLLKTAKFLFPLKNRSFGNENSSGVIKKIIDECKFKDDIKITTKDQMNWLQINQSNLEFINHILKRAYKSEDDALFCYVNRYRKMVYTSLNEEMKKKKPLIAEYNPKKMTDQTAENKDTKKEKEEGGKDDKDKIFFSNYKYINISSLTNKETGYGADWSYYDLDKADLQKKLLKSDEHTLTDASFKEKDNIGKLVKRTNMPITFKRDDNIHDNYILSTVQNEYIRNEFLSSYLLINANCKDNINLFDKVKVMFPSIDTQKDGPDLNQIYSGEYMVGQLVHQVTQNGRYRIVPLLFRTGINISAASKKSEVRLNTD